MRRRRGSEVSCSNRFRPVPTEMEEAAMLEDADLEEMASMCEEYWINLFMDVTFKMFNFLNLMSFEIGCWSGDKFCNAVILIHCERWWFQINKTN